MAGEPASKGTNVSGGGDSIVKKGGIGTDADAEDVSRDTYGFTGSENVEGGMSPEEARERLDEILPLDDKDG